MTLTCFQCSRKTEKLLGAGVGVGGWREASLLSLKTLLLVSFYNDYLIVIFSLNIQTPQASYHTFAKI